METRVRRLLADDQLEAGEAIYGEKLSRPRVAGLEAWFASVIELLTDSGRLEED